MGHQMTEAGLFEFYQRRFKLIYADLVAITAKKHLQVDAQIESAMSHLAVAYVAPDSGSKQENIDAAYGHLGRACLDAAKLLWLNRHQRVALIMNDKFVRCWCTNVPEAVLLQMQNKAENLARNARKADAMGAGHDAEALVMGYYDAISACQDIIDSVDETKVSSVRSLRWWYIMKHQFGGFVVGLLAAGIVAILAWKYLPPPPSEPIAPTIQPPVGAQPSK